MAKLKRLGLFFFAKLQAIMLGMIGLATGIVYSFGGAVYDMSTTGSVNQGTALAFLALLGIPILFACIGFAIGLIEALVYNLFAKWVGGIESQFNNG